MVLNVWLLNLLRTVIVWAVVAMDFILTILLVNAYPAKLTVKAVSQTTTVSSVREDTNQSMEFVLLLRTVPISPTMENVSKNVHSVPMEKDQNV